MWDIKSAGRYTYKTRCTRHYLVSRVFIAYVVDTGNAEAVSAVLGVFGNSNERYKMGLFVKDEIFIEFVTNGYIPDFIF